jgi:hypothetical protein
MRTHGAHQTISTTSSTMTSEPDSIFTPLKGYCTCRSITYTLTAPPLITHGCHCTFCQRESGSAFAINAMIEAYNFNITSTTQPTVLDIPSLSSAAGDAHLVAHCPKCLTAVYAHYGFLQVNSDKRVVCLKVGTLDDESKRRVRPDVHVFTGTKMERIDLESDRAIGAKIFEEYYDKRKI